MAVQPVPLAVCSACYNLLAHILAIRRISNLVSKRRNKKHEFKEPKDSALSHLQTLMMIKDGHNSPKKAQDIKRPAWINH